MAFSIHLRFTSLALLLAACGQTPSDEASASGTADTGGSDTGTASGSDTGDDPTSTADPSTSTGDPPVTTSSSTSTGPDPTTGTSGTTGTTDATTSNTTGGVEPCTLEHHACELAGQLGDFEDCGLVDPWNHDAAQWQAAHDCALAAATEERAFKLITILQGIDSDVGQAYVGQEARSYAISTLFFDSDPCGGIGCGPVITISSCASLTDQPDCEVSPGTICLSCDAQGQSSEVCGPP